MPRSRRERARKRLKGRARAQRPAKILVIDIGGTNVKLLASGQAEPRKFASGPDLDPLRLVERVLETIEGWDYEAVSIGYPGLVGSHGPQSEPGNLGSGWVGYNFAAAFERPVRIINDAAMQALGNYDGGRMLFIGLGTGVGSALIAEGVIVPLELGQLPLRRKQALSAQIGSDSLRATGRRIWRKRVARTVDAILPAFNVDYVVLGGGNAKLLGQKLPPSTRLSHNMSAFRGGLRLWSLPDVTTLHTASEAPAMLPPTGWRVI